MKTSTLKFADHSKVCLISPKMIVIRWFGLGHVTGTKSKPKNNTNLSRHPDGLKAFQA